MAAMMRVKSQGTRAKKQDAAFFEAEIEANLPKLVDLLIPCVTGWNVSAELKKAHPEDDFAFNDKSLHEFLSIDWVRVQVEEVVNDIANFTQK